MDRLQLGPVTVYFGEKQGKFPDGNQVVVHGTEAKAAFDTPLCANRLQGELAGTDLVILGHVHEDHTCGLHLLPAAQVYAPAPDAEALRSVEAMRDHYGYGPAAWEFTRERMLGLFRFQARPETRAYRDGQTWELGGVRVRAIHMPGHTRGHSVLLVEPLGIAFIGDIDLSGFGPYYGDACSDLAAFKRTLARIEHLPARVWITSHHKGVIQDRDTFLGLLRRFRARIDQHDEAILSALGGGGCTRAELAARRFFYPEGYEAPFVDDVERIALDQHLRLLTEEGRAVERDGRYRRAPAS
jgi:glyoxylase-like metal-dependent hydrolase (beta-lactamase superfamily II)